ncbi:MAG: hypothetical protein JKX75_04610 [Gammaproteobacteria bacterium]|nr:hypothetical protein [Gammaproteobacteria bacterium]
MNTYIIKTVLSLCVLLIVAACGGSGGIGFAGIGGSGYISSGSVSGFGSVFVNGVEYETGSAIFDIDGSDGTEGDLAIGMIVQVNGTINSDGVTGTATSISYDDELQGAVTDITDLNLDPDFLMRSFTVLGTNVIINSGTTTYDVSDDVPANTLFGFTEIADNNNVEISGFFNVNGDLIATRVELKEITFDANSIVEIKGIISFLVNTTFKIGSLNIDASSATLDDLPNGLIDGQLVEVKGTFNSGDITASQVEGEDSSVEDTDEFELEGLITAYVDDSDFKISGINVDASNATFKPSTLVLTDDVRVEAEGTIVNGILIASEIELRGGNAKIHATVSAVDASNNTFDVQPYVNQPTITITITISSSTKLEDDVNDIEPFTLTNLVVGDYVEVRGFDDGNGGVTATEVKVEMPDGVLLQGVIQDGSSEISGVIKIYGVEFVIEDPGETEFEGLNDVTIDNQADFFAAVTLDSTIVKVEDDDVNGTADEVEIESL